MDCRVLNAPPPLDDNALWSEDRDVKAQRLQTKCVPSPESLAEAVQSVLGEKGRFKIEVNAPTNQSKDSRLG